MNQVIKEARARGSHASTRAGAWRYLLSRIARQQSRPIPDDQPDRIRNAPARTVTSRISIAAWLRGGHPIGQDRASRSAARWQARAERIAGSERVQALAAQAIRQAKRVARQRRLAEEAAHDAPLRAQGYDLRLADDKRHRVLRGMDDGCPFEVEVPVRLTSIRGALDWLRPDGVALDAPRQGEWFFVPAEEEPELSGSDYDYQPNAWEPEGHETAAGTHSERRCYEIATFDSRGRHVPDACRVVERRGETAFIGRREVRTHSWVGRPRLYVRGEIKHPQHFTLVLDTWHEVIPNRALGPFGAGAFSPTGLD